MEGRGVTEEEFEEVLGDALLFYAQDYDEEISVKTFEAAGVLTRNKGLVVTTEDGTEFQVTIVKSRAGRKS